MSFNGTEGFGRKKCRLTELRALGGRSVVCLETRRHSLESWRKLRMCKSQLNFSQLRFEACTCGT